MSQKSILNEKIDDSILKSSFTFEGKYIDIIFEKNLVN